MLRTFGPAVVAIAVVRLVVFLSGWVLTTRYGDWRQLVGYPLVLMGALPDALLVRYVISPRSPGWTLAMVMSLVLSSAMFSAIWLRRQQRTV